MKKPQIKFVAAKQNQDVVAKAGKRVSIRSDPAIYQDKLLDVKEGAQLLKGVPSNKLYYHCKRGHLPHIWQNGKLFFSQAVLIEWHQRLMRSKRYQTKHECDGNNQGVGPGSL